MEAIVLSPGFWPPPPERRSRKANLYKRCRTSFIGLEENDIVIEVIVNVKYDAPSYRKSVARCMQWHDFRDSEASAKNMCKMERKEALS